MDHNTQIGLLHQQLEGMGISPSNHTAVSIRKIVGEELELILDDGYKEFIICYLEKLHLAAQTGNFKYIPFRIRRQLSKMKKSGKLSLYLAFVGHLLFKHLCSECRSIIYAGYIDKEGLSSSLHGFNMVDDHVIDVTYWNKIGDKELEDSTIYGCYPEDVNVFAWNMNNEEITIFKYLKMTTVKQICGFIDQHSQVMLKIIGEIIEENKNA